MNLSSAKERVRRVVRGTLPKSFYTMGASMLDTVYGVQSFGLREYKELSALRKAKSEVHPRPIRLRNLAHPFFVRPGTSDAGVLIQAMAREAYSYVLPSRPIHLVVDAGANIGDSTVWYANQFPEALVVAVEPDPANLNVLAMNCLPYGERISVLHAAVWPHAEKMLTVSGECFGAQVAESDAAHGLTCSSIDPLGILDQTPFDVIDIFKIDIEGAEEALFSGDCDAWLAKTRSIAVEIHSPDAARAVFSATERNGFKHEQYRGIHFFWQ